MFWFDQSQKVKYLRDLDTGKQQVRDTHFQSWGV